MSYYQADGHAMFRGIRYSLAICSMALILANLGAQNAWPATYTLQPFDTIRCEFILDPMLNEDLLIRPDGMITVQGIGDVRAAGLSPQGLARRIEDWIVAFSPQLYYKRPPSQREVAGQCNKSL
jgi:protein involved in polysaccharide export with SLBB domain